MRLVFLGTPSCAVPTLAAVLDAGHEVALVVTRPDRPVGRSREPQPPPVKRFAVDRSLTVAQPVRLKREGLAERLRGLAPDALVVVAYGRLLPAEWLGLPRLAPVNVHFSLLPSYRGAAPVQWSLAHGDEQTGVSTMWIDTGLDEGDILLQAVHRIAPDVHAPQLLNELADVGASLLVETLKALEQGTVERRAQDHRLATSAPLLRREHGEIAFTMPSAGIAGRIRGFDPWPGVWVRHAGRRIRLLAGSKLPDGDGGMEPGTVEAFDDGAFVIACGGGSRLALNRLQPAGKRAMSARDALNGRQLAVGDRFDP